MMAGAVRLSNLAVLPAANAAAMRGGAMSAPRLTRITNSGGQLIATLPMAPRAPSLAAGLGVYGIEQELLGKVIATPSAIAAGYVLADKQYTIRLWNANYSRPAKCVGINFSDIAGIDAGAASFDIAPGGVINRTITLKAAGKPLIKDAVTFVFAELPAGSIVNLTGSRLAMFALTPDWSDGISEAIRYHSSVIEAYSGAEQRASLVSKPVRTISFTALAMTGEQVAEADALLYGWQARAFGVPAWHLGRRLPEAALPGQTVLTLDTAHASFEPGGYIVVQHEDRPLDVLEVAEVGDGYIRLVDGIAIEAQAGANIVPVIVARLGEEVESAHSTRGVASYALTFTEEQA